MSKHTPISQLAREMYKPLPLPSFAPSRRPTAQQLELIARAEVRHRLARPQLYGIGKDEHAAMLLGRAACVEAHTLAVFQRHGLPRAVAAL